MRYRRSTPRELAILADKIQAASSRVTLWQLSKRTGFSSSEISKVRYLINCRPALWDLCREGLTTVNVAYRSGKDYNVWPIDGRSL